MRKPLRSIHAAAVLGLVALSANAFAADYSKWTGSSMTDVGLSTELGERSAPPAARSDVDPKVGPTTGGTKVVLGIDNPKFIDVDASGFLGAGIDNWGRIWAWSVVDPKATTSTGNGEIPSFGSPIPVDQPDSKKFVQVSVAASSSTDSVASFLASDGTIWSMGTNLNLGLGLADSEVDSYGALVRLPDTPASTRFTKVEAGPLGSVAIGEDGTLYGWGKFPLLAFDMSTWGETGEIPDGIVEDPETSSFSVTHPVHIPVGDSNTKIVDVSIGAQIGYAVDDSGHVWRWGYDSDLCEVAESGPRTLERVELPAGVKAGTVEAGYFNEASVIDSDGRMWTFGCSFVHGTGVGAPSNSTSEPTRTHLQPREVFHPTGKKWENMARAYSYATAVDADGDVFGWGMNMSGELGKAVPSVMSVLTSMMIDAFPDEPDVSALDVRDSFAAVPAKIPGLAKVTKSVVTGSTNGIIGLPKSGHPMVAGAGMHSGGGGNLSTPLADMTGEKTETAKSLMFDVDCLQAEPDDGYTCLKPQYLEMLMSGVSETELIGQLLLDHWDLLGLPGDPPPSMEPVIAAYQYFQPASDEIHPMTMPEYQLDHVTFDRIPAEVIANGDKSVTATAPQHAVGFVDVEATFTWRSGTRTGHSGPAEGIDPDTRFVPVVWKDGFEYRGEGAKSHPELTVTKDALLGSDVVAGAVIEYTIEATNAGDTGFTDVRIADDMPGLSPLVYDWSQAMVEGQLSVGESVRATGTYTVTATDVEAGAVINTAIATGTPEDGGDPVSSETSTTVPVDPSPEVEPSEPEPGTDTPSPDNPETLKRLTPTGAEGRFWIVMIGLASVAAGTFFRIGRRHTNHR